MQHTNPLADILLSRRSASALDEAYKTVWLFIE